MLDCVDNRQRSGVINIVINKTCTRSGFIKRVYVMSHWNLKFKYNLKGFHLA